MISLHPHQIAMVGDTRFALSQHRSVILRSPTGSGKTVCAAHIVQSAMNKGSTVIFTVHRRELIEQTREEFDNCGVQYGIISAGYKYDPMQTVYIASIDTLKFRLEIVPEPDLLIIDEAHHAIAKGWETVIKHYDECKIIGLTATPWRLDGKGLGKLFSHIVQGCETKWLIENKFLAPYRAFTPSTPDLSGVHTRMGDYNVEEIEERMDEPKITGDAIQHYQQICSGSRAVAFTTTVKHSIHVAESFNAAGIPARHVDGTMPKGERAEIIKAFRNDEIKVLTNCNIISEGFNVPGMDTAILLRPTKSLTMYLQQVGRALRYVEGKTAVILDHAGNIMEHGLPTDEFNWSLEGRSKKKSKSTVPVRICPTCFCAHPAALQICPQCGHTYQAKERHIAIVPGVLSEIDQNNWIKSAPYKKLLEVANTREQLCEIARIRGFKKGWVYHVMQDRKVAQ